ncbi:MAG: hypothetical protein GX434_06470 [Peptococcaceae bacterium]|nr:hypothetical protein [Peptococcaceae bacterium]
MFPAQAWLIAASSLAHARGLMTDSQLEKIINLLMKLDLPTSIEARDPEILLNHMSADKKNKAGNKILVLPVGIGKSSVATDCEDEEIVKAWKKVIK